MKKNFRLAMLKYVPEKWEVEKNFTFLKKFIEKAAYENADLLMTCECFLDGYCVRDINEDPDFFSCERFSGIAQDNADSVYINETRALAAKHDIHILLGYTQKKEDGFYNSAILIDSLGKDVGVYSKTHIYSHDEYYQQGKELEVFETKYGKMGVMICADRRWPETARTLKIKGADIILNPTYGMHHEENEMWMRTRAYENEIYIAFAHPEEAMILNPNGKIDAKLISNFPDLLIHTIDFSVAPNKMFPLRRPDLYVV